MEGLLTLNKSFFTPYYQSQVNALSDQLVGVEVLMRSSQADIQKQVAKLEAIGEIHQLDLFALQAAVRWSKENNLAASANFSGTSFESEEIISQINNIALPQDNIYLELTESKWLSKTAIANLKELNIIGYKLSLDDYGTQYNSLSRLLLLPFAQVKIDLNIIERLKAPDEKTLSTIKDLVGYCDKFGIELIAEGVETKGQAKILCDLGCYLHQGFLYHPPEQI